MDAEEDEEEVWESEDGGKGCDSRVVCVMPCCLHLANLMLMLLIAYDLKKEESKGHLQAWHFFLLEAVTWQALASPMLLQVNVSNLLPTRDLRKNARQEKQDVVK